MNEKQNNETTPRGADCGCNANAAPCCPAGCDCGSGFGRKTKIAICALVLGAVVAVFAYKITNKNAGEKTGGACCPTVSPSCCPTAAPSCCPEEKESND